uniref:C-type lectin domain-containing protein n=1 Tax=Oryzias latipes TaxID=8090 RepID=A0A3P9IA21_ORYLA
LLSLLPAPGCHLPVEFRGTFNCPRCLLLFLLGVRPLLCGPPCLSLSPSGCISRARMTSQCQEKYTDLATFDSLDDLNRLKADFSYSWAWIGLHDDPAAWKTSMGNKSNSWRWSATGQTSTTGYQSWNRPILDYLDAKETCVTMNGVGLWNDLTCNASHTFLCFNASKNLKKGETL